MNKNYLLFALLLTATFIFNSCDKDDPEIIIEEELITTVNYTLTPTDGGDSVTFTWTDLDGEGADAPVISGGTLAANQTYTIPVEFLNESDTLSEDITAEVKEEDEEHQVFFQSSISDLTFTYNDQDEDSNPLGLSSTLTTGTDGSGTLTIILQHEPDKNASGVSDGDITNAGGTSDVEATFPVDVQ